MMILSFDHNIEWRFLQGMWKFISTSRGFGIPDKLSKGCEEEKREWFD